MEVRLIIGLLLVAISAYALAKLFKDKFYGTKVQLYLELSTALVLALPAFVMAIYYWEPTEVSYYGEATDFATMFFCFFLLLALAKGIGNTHYRRMDILMIALSSPILVYGGIIQLIGFHESLILIMVEILLIELFRWNENKRIRNRMLSSESPSVTPVSYLLLIVLYILFVIGTCLMTMELMEMGIEQLVNDNNFPAIFISIGLFISVIILGILLWKMKMRDSFTRILVCTVFINTLFVLVSVLFFPFTEFM